MVCYAPGTGTLAVIGFAVYVVWHKAILHFFGMAGTTMEITLLLAAAALAAFVLIWTARMIRRRRAQAGACTTCRFRCQEALKARPNLLVNRVDRRVTPPAVARRAALTCHPAAPLLSRRGQPPRPPRLGRPCPCPRPLPCPRPPARPLSLLPRYPARPPLLPVPLSQPEQPPRRPPRPRPPPRRGPRPSPMPPFPRASHGPSLPARWCANRPGRSKPSPSAATSSPRTA